MRWFIVAALLTVAPTWGAKKAKPPKTPTQPDMSRACVTITKIYSHGLSLFSGIGSPQPGLDAVVQSFCATAATVFITVGYFDSKGVQIGSGMTSVTVAAGATMPIYHEASLYGLERGRLKLAKIIAADAFPLQ